MASPNGTCRLRRKLPVTDIECSPLALFNHKWVLSPKVQKRLDIEKAKSPKTPDRQLSSPLLHRSTRSATVDTLPEVMDLDSTPQTTDNESPITTPGSTPVDTSAEDLVIASSNGYGNNKETPINSEIDDVPRGTKRKKSTVGNQSETHINSEIDDAPRGTKRKKSTIATSRPKRQCARNVTYRAQDSSIIEAIDIAPPEPDPNDPDYIIITSPEGKKVRKRRANSHPIIKRFEVPEQVTDALDADPTWTPEGFRKLVGSIIASGISHEGKKRYVIWLLFERIQKPQRNNRTDYPHPNSLPSFVRPVYWAKSEDIFEPGACGDLKCPSCSAS